MSGARDQVIAVQKLLLEVRKLWLEKRRVELRNRRRGTYLRCVIFRKFALIDAILESSPEARNAMGKTVELKRKQVKAEAGDLERMMIPKLLEAKTVEKWRGGSDKQTEPFPYLNLLPEIRRVILGYLQAPLDKLSLTEAVPGDGEMMGWSAKVLKFEMVLPKLLDWSVVSFKKHLDYDDLVKLCHASDQLHDVVKKYFESCVAPNDRDYYFANRYMYNNQGTTVNPTEFTLNPLPTVFFMKFDAQETSVPHRNQQLQILRQIGKNIWSASIDIREISSFEALLIIQECLKLLPNLKFLRVFLFRLLHVQENHDLGENPELPELGHLRRLDLSGRDSGDIGRKLLERYRCVVTYLETAELMSVVPQESEGYPRLTGLEARHILERSMPPILSRLETFVRSPLKRILLELRHISINADTFRDLMLTLSKFGTTLEHLTVYLKSPKSNETTPNLSWLASVDFPKVETLSIQGYLENWAILLCFPALETLFWGEYDSGTSNRDSFEGGFILDLPEILGGDEAEEVAIWKMCPFLNKICIQGYRYDMHEKDYDNLTVWRSQSIKLDKINRDCGPPDTTIQGSMMGNILQSTDSGLVIRGDLTGDIVQNGNGRIQVGGVVEGNIWQNGSGKIFVRKEHRGRLFLSGNGTADIHWDGREDD